MRALGCMLACLVLTGASRAEGLPSAVVAIRSASPVCELPNPVACSGVVIAPTVVLTAAHCVATATSELEVVRGGDAASSRDVLAIAEIRIHPRYGTGAPAADLALLRLRWPTRAVPLTIGEAPHAGESLAWAGYGVARPDGETGRLHGGTVQVTDIVDGTVTVAGEQLPCSGDSGGAMFRPDGTLVALTRGGDAGCATHASGVVLAAQLDTLITPFLTTSDGVVDAPLDLADPRTCGAACEQDADCPPSFTCTMFEGEARCIHPGVPPGNLATACESAAACGGAPCFALVTQEGRTCGCLAPCMDASPGGCVVSRGAGAPLGTLLLLLSFRRRTNRRR